MDPTSSTTVTISWKLEEIIKKSSLPERTAYHI